MVKIRAATLEDQQSISHIYHAAFGDDEKDLVSTLAINLLSENTSSPILSIVAELGDSLIGHIAFSPVWLKNPSNSFSGYILAPLAVLPKHQGKHVGSTLVTTGLKQLEEMNTSVVFVYGDPKYYGRFGFNSTVAERFQPPYPLQYPYGWLASELRDDTALDKGGAIKCVTALCDSNLW